MVEATETVSVETADLVVVERTSLVGFRVAVRSREFVVALSATTPANPFSPVALTVDVAKDPGVTEDGEVGLAVKEKSVTTTVTGTDSTKVAPLGRVTVPFTVPS